MTVIQKAASGGKFEFVLSDETPDSYGDIVMANGWDLKRFDTNPVALWDHGKDPEIGRKPIGRWTNVRVEKGRLLGKLDPARGVSDSIDEIIKLHELGFLPAVSVGFQPIEEEPIDPRKPYEGIRYLKQSLLETSIVAIPANPSAVQLAKSHNISDRTLFRVFGEHAGTRRRDMSTGKHADTTTAAKPRPKETHTMKTLSERIVDATNDLNAKRDRLVELTKAEALDNDAIAELTKQVGDGETTIATLKGAEAKIGVTAEPVAKTVPASPRKPLGHTEKDGMDLLVRAAVARGVAHYSNIPLEKALEQRYPGHEAVAVIAKADQTIGTTGVSGWAAELVQTAYFGFLEALTGYSVFPDLLGRGLSLTFDQWGTLSLPRRTAGTAGGGFVAEGSPIRVGKLTTAAATLTPKKMGVIVAFSKELAKRSTPAIEGIVRQAILEDTATALDPILLDATAVSAIRPAGLLNGISAAASGYAGGDYVAVREDMKALLAPFYTANGADNIVVIMNPAQGLALSLMEGPVGDPNWLMRIKERVTFIESTNATANRLIAVRASDFAGAGGNPEFDVSEQATIHMEDTTPLEIVAGAPTVADPVRSLWQTASVGVRMLLDVSWTMRRTGVVQWIDGTTW